MIQASAGRCARCGSHGGSIQFIPTKGAVQQFHTLRSVRGQGRGRHSTGEASATQTRFQLVRGDLVPHRTPVLARVRAADQHATLEVDPDRLIAAEGAGGLGELVAFGFELAPGFIGNARLECDRAAALGRLAGWLG